MNKLRKLAEIYGFSFDDNNEPKLEYYGVYMGGLTSEEIDTYLMVRGNTLNVKRLRKKFDEIAGCNTCACTPDGRMLMYRHDVERFANILFGKSKFTYFD